MCAASAASASVVSLWMHDAPSGVGVGWVVLSTRYHVCLQSLHQQHALTDAQSRRAAITPCPGLQPWYSPPSRSLTAAELQHRQLPALAARDHPVTNATNRRQASSAKTARTRDNNTQPCVTEHRFLLPLTRTPKTPHYRTSSHQIAPISLDSGLPSTSPPPRRAHGQ